MAQADPSVGQYPGVRTGSAQTVHRRKLPFVVFAWHELFIVAVLVLGICILVEPRDCGYIAYYIVVRMLGPMRFNGSCGERYCVFSHL